MAIATESKTAEASNPLSGPLGPDREMIQRCIHCGLCTTSCPTFALLGNEMDSPRGRIYLMRMVVDGEMAVNATVLKHLDRCLDCRACETACPSGVKYGSLIEAAREGLEKVRERPLGVRLLRRFLFRWLLPNRALLAFAAAGTRLYQRTFLRPLLLGLGLIPEKLARLEPMMPEAPPLSSMLPLPSEIPAIGEERTRVAFFGGCLQSALFGDVNRAAVRALAANGARVSIPAAQTCCGALQAHAGDRETARLLARQNLEAIDPSQFDAIVLAVSGCGAMLHEYGALLARDPAFARRARAFSEKVMDVTVFLSRIQLRKAPHPEPQRVAYHHPCHLYHAMKVRQEPLKVLEAVGNVETVPLKESDWCCGSAGSYNLTQTELSMRLLDRKMGHVEASGAPVVCTGNPGCQIQITYGARERGMDLRVVHPVVLLDEAYRAAGFYEGAALP
ncbi:MAG: 4Fe-4S dicluster domain-containing protein [Candidatus Tectomicrobia bacterium]|uniref:Glycolate oxidase iron-sulfur subunit n=1 Tax=Tectimicrobiota bacterium TaxID=2528274 RepID=A0A932I2U6_UNCTE|nr:4Fe-4S dicluster domain-containing protein [Candidatus Tectomicrobia bacterium]